MASAAHVQNKLDDATVACARWAMLNCVVISELSYHSAKTNLSMQLRWSYLNGSNEEVGPLESSEMLAKRSTGEVTNSTIVRLWESDWTTIQDASTCLCWSQSPRNDTSTSSATPPCAPIYWSYIDCAGNEQGPFPNEYVKHYYLQGWFPDHTRVRLWPVGWNHLQFCLDVLPCSDVDWVDCASSPDAI